MSDIYFDGKEVHRNSFYDWKSGRWIKRDTPEYYETLTRNAEAGEVERAVNAYHAARLRELKQEFAAECLDKHDESYLDDARFVQWLHAPYMGGVGPEETASYLMDTGFSGGDGPLTIEVVRRHLSRSEALNYECRAYRAELERKANGTDEMVMEWMPGSSDQPAGMERKSIAYAVKAMPNGTLEGYAAVFGNVDAYNDIIQPGSFAKTLKEAKAKGRRYLFPLCRAHNPDRIIGGVSEADEDRTGLYFKATLALDTTDGKEAYSLIKQGMLSGVSIGYQTTDEDYDKQGHRLLKGINLLEISAVTLPANPEARIEVVS